MSTRQAPEDSLLSVTIVYYMGYMAALQRQIPAMGLHTLFQQTQCLLHGHTAGKFQRLTQQSVCLDCPANHKCAGDGTVDPTPCSAGTVTASGSALCSSECDYEKYYCDAALSRTCKQRLVICSLDKQYEVPSSLNRTQESRCMPLTSCNTVRMPKVSPIYGGA